MYCEQHKRKMNELLLCTIIWMNLKNNVKQKKNKKKPNTRHKKTHPMWLNLNEAQKQAKLIHGDRGQQLWQWEAEVWQQFQPLLFTGTKRDVFLSSQGVCGPAQSSPSCPLTAQQHLVPSTNSQAQLQPCSETPPRPCRSLEEAYGALSTLDVQGWHVRKD